MKKNNKGFMLVEAIISGTVVLTSMIVLYSTFSRLYGLYSERANYYSIDGVYATKLAIDWLWDKGFGKQINRIFDNNQYVDLIDGCNEGGCGVFLEDDNSENLMNGLTDIGLNYKVNRMIIAAYDGSSLEELLKNKDINLNESFREYIEYVIGYYGVSNGDTQYSYIVLTEIKDGNNYYYANLGIG